MCSIVYFCLYCVDVVNVLMDIMKNASDYGSDMGFIEKAKHEKRIKHIQRKVII